MDTGDEHPLSGLRPAPDPRDPRASELLRPWDASTPLADRVAVLGLPYDGGIPSRPGARFGPRALRDALGAFGAYGGVDLAPVLDLGDLALPGMNGREAHRRLEEGARRLFAAGARPLFLGGDHGCTGAVVRGLAAARPGLRLALVSVDAHLDVREYPDDASLSSGTPLRRALESGILAGARTAVVGVRRFANSRFYLDWAREREVLTVPVDAMAEQGPAAVARSVLAQVAAGADALYLTVDLDAADASAAPGVSAPGIGGLSSRELVDLVGGLASHPALIGADIMELSPPHDSDGRTAKLGARVLLELLQGMNR